MNKGLEALERLHEFAWSNEEYRNDMDNTDYQIIEKELKRLEELDNGAYVSIHINRYNELCDKEKALEIIKNTLPAFVYAITNSKDYQDYSSHYISPIITEEEYDLLKEVLL